MTSGYWKKVAATALIISLVICKSSWIFMFLSWGSYSDSFYNVHINVVNWPSVKLGLLPYFTDSVGNKGFDMGAALVGPRSTLVDTLAWFPVGFAVAHLFFKFKSRNVA
jgi:hypothetical protein